MKIVKLFNEYKFYPVTYKNEKYVVKIGCCYNSTAGGSHCSIRYSVYEYVEDKRWHKGKKVFSDYSEYIKIILMQDEKIETIWCNWDTLVHNWYFKEAIKSILDSYNEELQEKSEQNEDIKRRKKWDGVIE